MLFFSYLYIVVGVTLWQQKIEVMILNQYLQSVNQEIQSKSLTVVNTLIDPMISTDPISGITTTTGTAGTTIITGTLDSTDGNGLTIIGILTALFIIAHLLDRKYFYPVAEEQPGSMSTVEEDKEVIEMESTKTEVDMKK